MAVQAAKLAFRYAIFAGSPDDDLGTIVRYVESGAGFELPKTR